MWLILDSLKYWPRSRNVFITKQHSPLHPKMSGCRHALVSSSNPCPPFPPAFSCFLGPRHNIPLFFLVLDSPLPSPCTLGTKFKSEKSVLRFMTQLPPNWSAGLPATWSVRLLVCAANRTGTVRLCVSMTSSELIPHLAGMKSRWSKLSARFAPDGKHISAGCNTIAVSL